MMAGRRRSLGLVVVVAAVVLPLVLVPAPLVSSARAPPQAAFRYGSRAKPQAQKKILRSLLKKWAKDEVKDLLSSNSGGQLSNGASSSNTAGVFIFDLSVGTSSPPQDISGILDITSELVWSQCTPCDTCLPPPAPSYDPARSPTFANLSCDSQMCPQVLTAKKQDHMHMCTQALSPPLDVGWLRSGPICCWSCHESAARVFWVVQNVSVFFPVASLSSSPNLTASLLRSSPSFDFSVLAATPFNFSRSFAIQMDGQSRRRDFSARFNFHSKGMNLAAAFDVAADGSSDTAYSGPSDAPFRDWEFQCTVDGSSIFAGSVASDDIFHGPEMKISAEFTVNSETEYPIGGHLVYATKYLDSNSKGPKKSLKIPLKTIFSLVLKSLGIAQPAFAVLETNGSYQVKIKFEPRLPPTRLTMCWQEIFVMTMCWLKKVLL